MNFNLPFETELYSLAKLAWPEKGKHILASFKTNSIMVYQAYKPSIAEWVFKNQSFNGCPGFSMTRMTWIKTNFLWMMYRSDWANKVDQERILAIEITWEGFNKLLELCKKRGGTAGMSIKDESDGQDGQDQILVTANPFGEDDVRIQWDPDHDPYGNKLERRAIQIGIRGAALQKYIKEWVVSVSDITNFVKSQYLHVQKNELDLLEVPVQRVYDSFDVNIRKQIELDD